MKKNLSMLAYGVMVVGLWGLIANRAVFSPSPFVIVPQAGAMVLMVAARLAFGARSFHFAANPTKGGLVTWGPYRFIRHPIYTSVCLFVVPGVVAHLSWENVIFLGWILAGASIRVRLEESFLLAEYPEYADYSKKTWRMVPYVY